MTVRELWQCGNGDECGEWNPKEDDVCGVCDQPRPFTPEHTSDDVRLCECGKCATARGLALIRSERAYFGKPSE